MKPKMAEFMPLAVGTKSYATVIKKRRADNAEKKRIENENVLKLIEQCNKDFTYQYNITKRAWSLYTSYLEKANSVRVDNDETPCYIERTWNILNRCRRKSFQLFFESLAPIPVDDDQLENWKIMSAYAFVKHMWSKNFKHFSLQDQMLFKDMVEELAIFKYCKPASEETRDFCDDIGLDDLVPDFNSTQWSDCNCLSTPDEIDFTAKLVVDELYSTLKREEEKLEQEVN